MASNNQLLGDVKPVGVVKKPPEEQKYTPAWRFHKNCPEGKLVQTDEELFRLDLEGWKDQPGKVRLLPGFEHEFEG